MIFKIKRNHNFSYYNLLKRIKFNVTEISYLACLHSNCWVDPEVYGDHWQKLPGLSSGISFFISKASSGFKHSIRAAYRCNKEKNKFDIQYEYIHKDGDFLYSDRIDKQVYSNELFSIKINLLNHFSKRFINILLLPYIEFNQKTPRDMDIEIFNLTIK